MSTSSVILGSIGTAVVKIAAFFVSNAIVVILGVIVLTVLVRYLKDSERCMRYRLRKFIAKDDHTHMMRYLFKNPSEVLKGFKKYPAMFDVLYETTKTSRSPDESNDFVSARIVAEFWRGAYKAKLAPDYKSIFLRNSSDDRDTFCRISLVKDAGYGSVLVYRDEKISFGNLVSTAETKIDVWEFEEYLKSRYPHDAYHYYDGVQTEVTLPIGEK